MRRGFTIVELLVVLVIITVLLSLGLVGVRGLQANARDQERKSDVESIARGLERRYETGNTYFVPNDAAYANEGMKGSYPSINEFLHIDGTSRSFYTPNVIDGGYRSNIFSGTSDGSFTSPSGVRWGAVCVFSCQPAENTAQITSGFGGQDKYVYEPYDAAGNICSIEECTGYNLYWKK